MRFIEQARLEREKNRAEKSTALFALKQRGFEIDRETERLEKEFRDMSGSVLRSSNWNTRDLISRSDISGVKGLLGEFLSIPSAYRTAVESVSRAVLFNVVVDSDEVADVISAKLSGGKGRVTLCAINRVGDESQSAECMARDIQKSGLHAQLLSSVITPREDFVWIKKMILKFFSKTAIVDSLDTGVEVAKRFNIDAVTVDGDVVSRDLVVKGGDLMGSRKQTEVVRNWQQSLELKLKISALKREQTSVAQKTRNLENEIRELSSQYVEKGTDPMVTDLKNRLETAKRQLHALMSQKSDLEKFQIVNLRDVELWAIAEDISRTRNELIDVKKRRSFGEVKSGDEDLVPISEIQSRLEHVEVEIGRADECIGTVQKRVASLKSELDHFIENRISHLCEVTGEYLKELSVRRSQAQKLSEQIQLLESTELLRVEADLRRVEAEQAEVRTKKESALQERSQVETERNSIAQEIQTLTTTVKGKEIKLSSIETDLVSLGVATSSLSATPTIGGTVVDLRQLRARIVDINIKLNSNKFVYLNKKSVDQFERVSAERAELVARFQELEETHNNIRELLSEMAEKEKAMIRDSFSRVQLYFRALFVRLIGEGGSADLRLEIDQDSQSGILGRVSVEQVSIPAGGDVKSKHKHLHELSGGQRTMVALCFLLALQKASSESKNYLLLLDEVDAALDSNYRAAIAEVLVHETASNGTQVLLTSFRPEFCSVADKHWLVSMVNGSTRIDSVDVATALALVSGEPRYQEPPHNEISVRE
jgi:structural maintenance of chromosome 3 (chondroitin sulfate proteoglycan 6)